MPETVNDMNNQNSSHKSIHRSHSIQKAIIQQVFYAQALVLQQSDNSH